MRTAFVYNFLLEATLMASIAILLMIPIRRYGRKWLGSRTLCFGWALAAFRLLCLLTLPNPVIHEIRPAFEYDAAIRPIAGQIKVRLEDTIYHVYRLSQNVFGETSAVSEQFDHLVDSTHNGMLAIHMMHLYVLGFVLAAAWFVFCNVRFRRQMKAARIEPISGEALAVYERLCQELKMKPLPVYYVDPLPSACLVGVLRPYIALPLTVKPQEVSQVLRHELCHYRAKHHWFGMARLACCALHWFNPLVWIAAHMSRTDIELACDERVTRGMTQAEKQDYASVLVLAAAKRDLPGVGVLSTGMSMTGKKLKARVASVLSDSTFRKGWALTFALLASMALVGAFATAEAPRLALPDYANQPVEAAYFQKRDDVGTALETPEDEANAIAYAQQIWQNPYLQTPVDGLGWKAQAVNGHIEVFGMSEQEEIELAMAYLPEDGRIIYVCNFRHGPTESIVSEPPLYANDPSAFSVAREYGLAAIASFNPGESATFDSFDEPHEGEVDENRSLWFGEWQPADSETGGLHRTFRVLVEPEMKLIYYSNMNYMTWDDTDRIEPGNG